jgi:hypothetical protein
MFRANNPTVTNDHPDLITKKPLLLVRATIHPRFDIRICLIVFAWNEHYLNIPALSIAGCE